MIVDATSFARRLASVLEGRELPIPVIIGTTREMAISKYGVKGNAKADAPRRI